MENKIKIHEKPWFIGIMIFFFWPVGLALLWRSDAIDRIVKFVITVIVIFFLLSWFSQSTIPTSPELSS